MKCTVVAIWLVVALLAGGCSSGSDESSSADESAASSLAATVEAPPAVSSSGALQVVVFGMRNGTRLSLLDEPGGTEIAQIESGANDVYFTGQSQTDAAGEFLWQVEFGSTVGWVPPRFGYPAAREDVTADVMAAFGATSPAQEKASDTALVVSGVFAITSPPTGMIVSRIVEDGPPEGFVVIDIVDEQGVGLPGVLGYRLEVRSELGANGKYEVTRVWRTAMCQNGASAGRCL